MATLGEQAVGSTVLLNIDGIAREHVVIQQGNPNPNVYENSCDGTWILLNVAFDVHVLNASTMPNYDYANSKLHNYLNTTYINRLDRGARNAVKQIKIPYTLADVTDGSVETLHNGLPAKVFLLSCTETGFTGEGINVEGAVLQWFNNGNLTTKRIFYTIDATKKGTILRTPNLSIPQYMYSASQYGGLTSATVTGGYYIRPALVLPYETIVNADGLIEVPVSKAITGSVTIGGVQRELTGEGYVNINGVLRPLVNSQVNIGGVLRDLRPMYTWKKYTVAEVEGAPYVPETSSTTETVEYTRKATIQMAASYTFDSSTGLFTLDTTSVATAENLSGTLPYFSENTQGSSIKKYVSKKFELTGGYTVTYYPMSAVPTKTQICGNYISDVTSENASAYPDNRVHTDGYWYIKQ